MMNIDEISRIAGLMTDHDLTEFVVESPEIKLSIKRHLDQPAAQVTMVAAPVAAAPAPVVAAPAPVAAATAPAAAEPAKAPVKAIESPIVGTFYSCPAPDAPPFVKVGDTVTDETVVCIIEAMKVMNEIKAEKRGIIRKVLIENAQPVEFGQPLFEIE